jgi:protein O-GlcNAc transferase
MPQLTIQQAFDLAQQHHRAGRLNEAEKIYRGILAQQPGHFDSMHFLGILAHQMGRNDIAVDLIRRAIALKPSDADAKISRGVAPSNKF